MPTITVSTGILEETHFEKSTGGEWKSFSKKKRKYDDALALILKCEIRARSLLRQHCIRWPAGNIAENNSKFLKPFTKWQEACRQNPSDRSLNEAGMILLIGRGFRRSMLEGNINEAVRHAFAIAQLDFRLFVRPHEKFAITGKKTREAGERGRKSQGRKYNDAAANHEKWGKLADEIRQQAKHRKKPLSENRIAKMVSDQFEANYWTVRSALKNQRKKTG